MSGNWWQRLAVFSFAIASARADVLDDLGITASQFTRGFSFPVFEERGTRNQSLVGLEISDEHARTIEAELRAAEFSALQSFYEGRGNYSKALEGKTQWPLDRVRLLLRAGRLDDARAALTELAAENRRFPRR